MSKKHQFSKRQVDAKMGTAESSQSSELGGIGGFNGHSSFRRQSPNVARLIRGENSQKMEYEFPISDINTSNLGHYYHNSGTSNHTIITGNNNRHISSSQSINHNENIFSSNTKISSNESSSLWLSLTSCFGCRTRENHSSTMNPLRDKVHAIRIVRASNDLTPAVFDSHYNIITLEQLRECDNNTNASSVSNDSSDPLPAQNMSNTSANAQNGNGSVGAGGISQSSSTKKDTHTHRLKKKKKKRSASATYASRPAGSDDDEDDDDRSGRT